MFCGDWEGSQVGKPQVKAEGGWWHSIPICILRMNAQFHDMFDSSIIMIPKHYIGKNKIFFGRKWARFSLGAIYKVS